MLRPILSIHTLLLLTCMALLGLAGGSFAAGERSYAAGNYFLLLDGQPCGLLKQVAGGAISAGVVEEPAGVGAITRKHLGALAYEPITVQCGFSMAKPINDWITASLTASYMRKNGEIKAADFSRNVKSIRQFFNALITEIGFPACDGAAKTAYLTLSFAPELIREIAPPTPDTVAAAPDEQKVWLPSNFKLEIDGIDCTRVSKIDAFTIKQKVSNDGAGEVRTGTVTPGKLVFPNLKVTIAEAGAQSWRQWFDDFVIKGNNGQEKEKNGRLIFLSPDRTKELARVEFFNLGIFRLAPDNSSDNNDQIMRVTVELYCERMTFTTAGPGTLRLPSINLKDIFKLQ